MAKTHFHDRLGVPVVSSPLERIVFLQSAWFESAWIRDKMAKVSHTLKCLRVDPFSGKIEVRGRDRIGKSNAAPSCNVKLYVVDVMIVWKLN